MSDEKPKRTVLQAIGQGMKWLWKLKRLRYPILAVIGLLVASNLWFNIEHYRMVSAAQDGLEFSAFRLEAEKGSTNPYEVKSTTSEEVLLPAVFIVPAYDYRYYFYPFELPGRYPNLINLDGDPETEILYNGAKGFLSFHPMYHDFDPATGQFVSRHLADLSTSKYVYALEVRKFLWGPVFDALLYLGAGLFLYYLLALLIYGGLLVWRRVKAN